MADEKLLAMEEASEYERALDKDRAGFKGQGEFIAAAHPDRTAKSVKYRNRLLRAGSRSVLLWDRIEAGMPLSTAVRLLCECEATWGRPETRPRGFDVPFSSIVAKRLEQYDAEGHVCTAGGKVYRVTTQKARVARTAVAGAAVSGDTNGKAARAQARSGTRASIREAVAAWLGQMLTGDAERKERLADACLIEIDAVLDSYTGRVQQVSLPDRSVLTDACVRLGVPKPRWGQPVDLARARKNQRSILRSTHQDVVGHDGGTPEFIAAVEAYKVLASYNEALEERQGKQGKKNGNGSEGAGQEDGEEGHGS